MYIKFTFYRCTYYEITYLITYIYPTQLDARSTQYFYYITAIVSKLNISTTAIFRNKPITQTTYISQCLLYRKYSGLPRHSR